MSGTGSSTVKSGKTGIGRRAPQPPMTGPLRGCIVSDGAFGDRAFERCLARFSTDFALVEPLPPTVVDDVAIVVPEADLYLSFLRSPAQALALVEKGRPVILGVSFGPGFVRQAQGINPAVVAPETMCSLEPATGNHALDTFARAFGRPEFAATVRDGKLVRLEVLRGSPCGSTAAASAELVDQSLSPETLRHFGLPICHNCRAPRLGRTCDKESAGLIHVREPPQRPAARGNRCRDGRLRRGVRPGLRPTEGAVRRRRRSPRFTLHYHGDPAWLRPRSDFHSWTGT